MLPPVIARIAYGIYVIGLLVTQTLLPRRTGPASPRLCGARRHRVDTGPLRQTAAADLGCARDRDCDGTHLLRLPGGRSLSATRGIDPAGAGYAGQQPPFRRR
jgi:hypothetical protein